MLSIELLDETINRAENRNNNKNIITILYVLCLRERIFRLRKLGKLE